jgi:hypothetical protein
MITASTGFPLLPNYKFVLLINYLLIVKFVLDLHQNTYTVQLNSINIGATFSDPKTVSTPPPKNDVFPISFVKIYYLHRLLLSLFLVSSKCTLPFSTSIFLQISFPHFSATFLPFFPFFLFTFSPQNINCRHRSAHRSGAWVFPNTPVL